MWSRFGIELAVRVVSRLPTFADMNSTQRQSLTPLYFFPTTKITESSNAYDVLLDQFAAPDYEVLPEMIALILGVCEEKGVSM